MKTETDTPRTDKMQFDRDEDCALDDDMVVQANFARELERELNASEADYAVTKDERDQYRRELNAAKAEIARLTEVAAEHITRYNETSMKLETALFGPVGDSYAKAKALAEQNGKLAHDNGITAMKYRKQRIILQAALEEIATGAYCMKTAYDHIAPNAIKQANQLDEL